MKCQKCGSTIDDNSNFCPNCGVKVEKEQIYVCPNCGTDVTRKNKFCPNCGNTLKFLDGDISEYALPKQSNNKPASTKITKENHLNKETKIYRMIVSILMIACVVLFVVGSLGSVIIVSGNIGKLVDVSQEFLGISYFFGQGAKDLANIRPRTTEYYASQFRLILSSVVYFINFAVVIVCSITILINITLAYLSNKKLHTWLLYPMVGSSLLFILIIRNLYEIKEYSSTVLATAVLSLGYGPILLGIACITSIVAIVGLRLFSDRKIKTRVLDDVLTLVLALLIILPMFVLINPMISGIIRYSIASYAGTTDVVLNVTYPSTWLLLQTIGSPSSSSLPYAIVTVILTIVLALLLVASLIGLMFKKKTVVLVGSLVSLGCLIAMVPVYSQGFYNYLTSEATKTIVYNSYAFEFSLTPYPVVAIVFVSIVLAASICSYFLPKIIKKRVG